MPVYFLPSTREEDAWAEYMMKDRNEPCWLCKRQKRKTLYGYMCWECQETKPIWEAELAEHVRLDYERKKSMYVGPCIACGTRLVAGEFECVTCRKEWEW